MNQTNEYSFGFNKSKEYFEPKEKHDLDSGYTVSELLNKKYKWNTRNVRKKFKIDLNSFDESVLKHKEDFKEIKISDIIIPGGMLLFKIEGAKKAGFKNFFSMGFRALDLSAWESFIKEGVPKTWGQINYHRVYDRWWLITGITNYTVSLTSFTLGIGLTFPNLILIEPDYVSVKIPNQEEKQFLDMYLNSGKILNENATIFKIK